MRGAGALGPIAGSLLALAAGYPMAGCGSGSDGGGGGSAGSGGTGGGAGDAQSDAEGVCGDGVLAGNEECDNGPKNAKGSGCEPDCKTSCHVAADCEDGEPCNGNESCGAVTAGRKCQSGTPPAEGSACGQGGYCKASVCTQPTCGNSVVEPGEDCDPPGTATCSSDCKTMVCGDGKIVGSEQCDDGNTTNLDGCDSSCRYEVAMRFTNVDLRTDPAPSFCDTTENAMGGALADEVAQGLSKSINDATNGGANHMVWDLGGMPDPSGGDAASLNMGYVAATLDPKYPKAWATGAIDAWVLAQQDQIDAKGNPLQALMPASISAHVLQAGPSRIVIRLVSGTTTSELEARNTRVRAGIDLTTPPDVPAPPPGALASGVKVFRGLDGKTAGFGMCGTATVSSLANVVLPQDFALGANACLGPPACSASPTYTYCGPGQPVGPGCNSLLDLIVGGCKLTALCIPAVTATQPNVGTGTNAPQPLTLGANNKVTPTAPDDGYSFSIKFTANRVHLTNNVP